MLKNHFVPIALVLSTGLHAQTGSRLVGTSFRGAMDGMPLVLSDSLHYTYSGARGGDMGTSELQFDRSYHWGLGMSGSLALQNGHARTYDAVDHALTDSSVVFNGTDAIVTSFLRWTYDGQGRPVTQVGFQGPDSVGFTSYSYTATGKPEQTFRSQRVGGSWLNTTEVYTYNAMDSLTDKVVTSDFLSYAFH